MSGQATIELSICTFGLPITTKDELKDAAQWAVSRYQSVLARVQVSEINIELVSDKSLGNWRGDYVDGDTPHGEVCHGPVTYIVIDSSKIDPVACLLHEIGHVL